jgi:hypothetical protein
MLGFMKKKRQPKTSGEWRALIAELDLERVEVERKLRDELSKRVQLGIADVESSLDHQEVIQREQHKLSALIAHAVDQLKRAEAAEAAEQDANRRAKLKLAFDKQREMAGRIDDLLSEIHAEVSRFEDGRRDIVSLGGKIPRRTRLMFTAALKAEMRDMVDWDNSLPGTPLRVQVEGLPDAQQKEVAA